MRIRGRRVRVLTAAAATATMLILPLSPADAALSTSPVVLADADDVAIPLDIRSVSYSADDAFVTFTVETFAVTADADADFEWLVDTTGDGSYDYDVTAGFDAPAGGFAGVVEPRSGATSRSVEVTRPSPSSLRVRVALDDLGRPSSLEYQTIGFFDTNADDVVQNGEIDVAGLDGQGDLILRFAGSNRVETAVTVSEATFFGAEAPAAVLAVSTGFADALAAAPLAAAKRGPLLLTPTDALDGRTEDELRRVLAPGATVYVLGGVTALSALVSSRVAALGYNVVRLAGTNRFDTAIEIADKGLGNPSTLLLSTGTDFPDGLTAGAAAASRNGAVLLTNGATMPPSVAAYIQSHGSAQRFAIGGPAGIADPAATKVIGADRYDTSRRTAEQFFTRPGRIGVAVGTNFPDALSGGANMALVGGPLLLTPPQQLAAPVADYLAANAGSIVIGAVFGGRAVVADTVRTAIASAIK